MKSIWSKQVNRLYINNWGEKLPSNTTQVNESEFNEKLKRVTVDVVIPREAEVIVRNYAKNTANETLTGISTIGM